MITLELEFLDAKHVIDASEHYYGTGSGPVLVLETFAQGRALTNGLVQGPSEYRLIWTGQAIRQANDLEQYLFRKRIN